MLHHVYPVAPATWSCGTRGDMRTKQHPARLDANTQGGGWLAGIVRAKINTSGRPSLSWRADQLSSFQTPPHALCLDLYTLSHIIPNFPLFCFLSALSHSFFMKCPRKGLNLRRKHLSRLPSLLSLLLTTFMLLPGCVTPRGPCSALTE